MCAAIFALACQFRSSVLHLLLPSRLQLALHVPVVGALGDPLFAAESTQRQANQRTSSAVEVCTEGNPFGGPCGEIRCAMKGAGASGGGIAYATFSILWSFGRAKGMIGGIMGWLSAIFGGSNPTLSGDIGQSGQIAGFGTGVGEGDIGAASGFYNDLLGGNSATEAKLLAPQIQTMQQQGQQQLDTASQFGNRSGGTNAAAQQNQDTTRGNIDNMISQLTGQGAAGLANLGTSSLGLGLSANQQQADQSQLQMQNWQNSILGGVAAGGVGNLGTGLSEMGSGLFGY